jgi:hypothetical protein
MVMPLYVGWELDACPVARVLAAILVCDAQRDKDIRDGGGDRQQKKSKSCCHYASQKPAACSITHLVLRQEVCGGQVKEWST